MTTASTQLGSNVIDVDVGAGGVAGDGLAAVDLAEAVEAQEGGEHERQDPHYHSPGRVL